MVTSSTKSLCGTTNCALGGPPNALPGLRSIFFFSSRRRHTRLQGDWSSDVCSSDLLHVVDFVGVLGGYHDLADADGARPFVHDADLSLAVGAEPRKVTRLAHDGESDRKSVV